MRRSAPHRPLQQAIIAVLNVPSAERLAALQRFSARDWDKSYWWLDSSGLTLPLAAIILNDAACALPQPVRLRLQCNLDDHRHRADEMLEHFRTVTSAIEHARPAFAVQKGYAGFPDYWDDHHLRLQLDLDFLVHRDNAQQIAGVLRSFGYVLTAAEDDEWKFETNPGAVLDHSDLYRPPRSRTVELHFAAFEPVIALATPDGALDRLRPHEAFGMRFPVLDPRDNFLQQALHVFQHVVSYSVRLSHLAELRRFIRRHHADHQFWTSLRLHCDCDPRLASAIGIALALTATVFPLELPQQLAVWTTRVLRPQSRAWISRFGRRWCLEAMPGSKTSLVLLREVLGDAEWRRFVAGKLLPFRRPRHHYAVELASDSSQARRAQRQFMVRRGWFHAKEALRFAASYAAVQFGGAPRPLSDLPAKVEPNEHAARLIG